MLTEGLEKAGYNSGTNVFEADWDVLLVLDACRWDAMQAVADEFDWLPDEVLSWTSVGSGSRGWLRRTFTEEYHDVRETHYVTGNPNTETDLHHSLLKSVDEVWRYEWDETDMNTIHPEAINDRLIATRREHPNDRVIAHYMQPHYGFIPRPETTRYTDSLEPSIWRAVLRGRVDADAVWEAYMENLRYVLNAIEVVFNNMDAETVIITADHGNAIGEWGIYGHGGPPIDVIRKVPWITLSATDSCEYTPELEPPKEASTDVESRLRDLGYK
jgi:hypothetical protein